MFPDVTVWPRDDDTKRETIGEGAQCETNCARSIVVCKRVDQGPMEDVRLVFSGKESFKTKLVRSRLKVAVLVERIEEKKLNNRAYAQKVKRKID